MLLPAGRPPHPPPPAVPRAFTAPSVPCLCLWPHLPLPRPPLGWGMGGGRGGRGCTTAPGGGGTMPLLQTPPPQGPGPSEHRATGEALAGGWGHRRGWARDQMGGGGAMPVAQHMHLLSPWGALSHSPRTAPVITLLLPGTPLHTSPPPPPYRSVHDPFKTASGVRVATGGGKQPPFRTAHSAPPIGGGGGWDCHTRGAEGLCCRTGRWHAPPHPPPPRREVLEGGEGDLKGGRGGGVQRGRRRAGPL